MIKNYNSNIIKRFEKIIIFEVVDRIINIIGTVRKGKKLFIERHIFYGFEPIDYHEDGSIIRYNEDCSGYFNKGLFHKFKEIEQ